MYDDYEDIVWPDAQEGITARLSGVSLLGKTLQPEATPKSYDFGDDTVVVQLETVDTTEGDIDRTEEVRLTVYGRSTYGSKRLFEAILSLLSGTYVDTPETDNSPAFFFDEIKRGRGPSLPPYPDDNFYPAQGTVLCRARPMD